MFEVTTHDADLILRTELLELLAGRSLVAWQVMDGANSHISIASEMGADVSRRLEDHAFGIVGIESAVWENRSRIDHEDVQITAAIAAPQADHDGTR
jgi:hypothetical protein